MTMFVVEQLRGPRLSRLFTLAGVDYYATPRSWLNIFLFVAIGIVIALISQPVNQLSSQLLVGSVYGFLIIIASFCHGFGHIISSRVVNASVKSILMTATVQVTSYEDDEDLPSRIHIGRALGGPTFNLFLGCTSGALYVFSGQHHYLLLVGCVNLVFGVMTLLPIPSLDGSVLMRELRHWRR